MPLIEINKNTYINLLNVVNIEVKQYRLVGTKDSYYYQLVFHTVKGDILSSKDFMKLDEVEEFLDYCQSLLKMRH